MNEEWSGLHLRSRLPSLLAERPIAWHSGHNTPRIGSQSCDNFVRGLQRNLLLGLAEIVGRPRSCHEGCGAVRNIRSHCILGIRETNSGIAPAAFATLPVCLPHLPIRCTVPHSPQMSWSRMRAVVVQCYLCIVGCRFIVSPIPPRTTNQQLALPYAAKQIWCASRVLPVL